MTQNTMAEKAPKENPAGTFNMRMGNTTYVNGAGLLHVGALELIIAGNGLSHHRHVQHDSTVVDLLVKVVITPFGLSYWEF